MKICCVADLHGYFPETEEGDLLIVAGDLTSDHSQQGYDEFVDWIDAQKFTKKIVIAGNHDKPLAKWHQKKTMIVSDFRLDKCVFTFLNDSGTEFEGLKIWGSPWTTTFPGMNPLCKYYTVDSEGEMMDKFDLIPSDIDILITHSPPYSILDEVEEGDSVGSSALYGWLKYVGRPKLHVFGHIHEAYGREEVFVSRDTFMMQSVNASHVNRAYEPVNPPIYVDL